MVRCSRGYFGEVSFGRWSHTYVWQCREKWEPIKWHKEYRWPYPPKEGEQRAVSELSKEKN